VPATLALPATLMENPSSIARHHLQSDRRKRPTNRDIPLSNLQRVTGFIHLYMRKYN
jgi:hypothetical protein